MKLLIVLALLGAVYGEEVEPVMVEQVDIPEFVDFRMAYVPESVAREVGLAPFDEPSVAQFVDDDVPQFDDIAPQFVDDSAPQFVDENVDNPDFIYENPVEAPVEQNPAIAPGELEAVRVEDILDFNIDPKAFEYGVKVEEPVFADAPQFDDNVRIYDNPTWR